jgi:hypothetical protein
VVGALSGGEAVGGRETALVGTGRRVVGVVVEPTAVVGLVLIVAVVVEATAVVGFGFIVSGGSTLWTSAEGVDVVGIPFDVEVEQPAARATRNSAPAVTRRCRC